MLGVLLLFYSSFSAEDIFIGEVCETIWICEVGAFHIDISH